MLGDGMKGATTNLPQVKDNEAVDDNERSDNRSRIQFAKHNIKPTQTVLVQCRGPDL